MMKILHIKSRRYSGSCDVIKVDNRYFQTWDSEDYGSGLEEITEKKFNMLRKHEDVEKS